MNSKDNQTFSLETLEFLIRRPLHFIYPFVIITTMALTYAAGIPKTYESQSVISIGDIEGEHIPWRFRQKGESLAAKVLLGENIRWMIGNIWPEISEETDPAGYAGRVDRLKRGISYDFTRRIPGLITVSFKSNSPDLCYKVVRSAIDVLRMESARTMEESINASIIFITQQMSVYQERLAAINSEMVKVSTRLREMAMGLNVEQRELVHRITEESVLEQRPGERAVMDEARSTEVLADLEMQLVVARRKKQLLESRLERGDFERVRSESRAIQEDIYAKAIERKKMEMFELSSERGYMPAHPVIRKLQRGIEDLVELREKHAAEFVAEEEKKLSENEKRLAIQMMREEIEELDFVVGTLEAQIEVMKEYSAVIEEMPALEEALIGPVADVATRLKGLRDEKSVIMRYYSELRRELETVDLKSRAEESRAQFIVDIIEPPRVPIKPLPSRKSVFLMLGLIMAVASGTGLSYVADMMDKSVWSAADLRNKLHIPVLASVVRMYSPGEAGALKARRKTHMKLLLAAVLASFVFMKIAGKVLGF